MEIRDCTSISQATFEELEAPQATPKHPEKITESQAPFAPVRVLTKLVVRDGNQWKIHDAKTLQSMLVFLKQERVRGIFYEITSLSIGNLPLDGEMEGLLGELSLHLSGLESLELEGEDLFKSLASSVQGKYLKLLSLKSMGHISDAEILKITANCPSLQKLSIDECPCITPQIFSDLQEHPVLERFSLNGYLGIVRDTKDDVDRRERDFFGLSMNTRKDLETAVYFLKIEHQNGIQNQISEFEYCGKLKEKQIDWQDPAVVDLLAQYISYAPHTEMFYFEGANISDEVLKVFSHVRAALFFVGCPLITDQGIKPLLEGGCEELGIGKCSQVTGEIFQSLPTMPKLLMLDFDLLASSKESIPENSLAKLCLIHVSDEEFERVFYGAGSFEEERLLRMPVPSKEQEELWIDMLAKQPQLEELSMQSPPISDDGFAQGFSKVLLLKKLSLCGAFLKEKGLEALKGCTQLQALALADCPYITQESLMGLLAALPNLQELVIQNCALLSEEAIEALQKKVLGGVLRDERVFV